MFCLEPMLLSGYLFMALPIIVPQRNIPDRSNLNAPMVEIHSCERGLGLDVKAATSGLYAVETTYGLVSKSGEFSLGIMPKVGVSYAQSRLNEQQSQTNFSLGTQILFGYKERRLAFEWWHISNGDLGQQNQGIDMFTVTTGWTF